MDSSASTSDRAQTLRTVLSRLREPITQLDELEELLSNFLLSLGLRPHASTSKLISEVQPAASRSTRGTSPQKHARLITSIQDVVLSNVVPAWDQPLLDDDTASVLEDIFCHPDSSAPAALELALSAYTTLTATTIIGTPFALRVLPRLLEHYPVDALHAHSFASGVNDARLLEWEALLKSIGSLPARVANVVGEDTGAVPEALRYREYSTYLCQRITRLVQRLADSKPSDVQLSSASLLLLKATQIGLFPIRSTDPLSPSYFSIAWPSLIRQSQSDSSTTKSSFSRTWMSLIGQLPTSSMKTFLISLLSSFPKVHDPLSTRVDARQSVKSSSRILGLFVGLKAESSEEQMAVLSDALLHRMWDEHIARMVVCCYSGLTESSNLNENALISLSESTLEVWSSSQHTQNPSPSRHRYITSLLLLSWSYLPSDHPYLMSLATSPQFLRAVSKYLGNMDATIRLLGMAVAEEVAKLSGRKLEFGNWDGNEDGRAWIRGIRELIRERDADVVDADPIPSTDAESHAAPQPAMTSSLEPEPASNTKAKPASTPRVPAREPDSDDDSLIGYSSSPSSSRAPSPTPSELDEIEKDPTLRAGGGLNNKKKRVTRPVYLLSLGELLRPEKDEGEEEMRKIEMALDHGEELIRRKRDYGTELEENAANLCIGFLSIQDKYETDRFEARRTEVLAALVACCPAISAPCLIEQFFHHQWSTTHRYAILNALALGARELAGLPIPLTAARQSARVEFPSKLLPPALHQKYLAEGATMGAGALTSGVESLADGIVRLALQKGKAEAEEKVPEIIREKQLRIRKTAPGISEVRSTTPGHQNAYSTPARASYASVAAEYFVIPLLERFWTYLRDEQTRETRSAYASTPGTTYRGAGTGMILDALTLKHYISTLAVLLHAARHSPAFLRIMMPAALELAGTLGSKPISASAQTTEDDDADVSGDNPGRIDKANSVLAACLELALVVLDAATELDQGRTLALENTSILAGTREWASEIFLKLEANGGVVVDGKSGEAVNRIRRAAAGVLLRVEDILEHWQRAMVNL